MQYETGFPLGLREKLPGFRLRLHLEHVNRIANRDYHLLSQNTIWSGRQESNLHKSRSQTERSTIDPRPDGGKRTTRTPAPIGAASVSNRAQRLAGSLSMAERRRSRTPTVARRRFSRPVPHHCGFALHGVPCEIRTRVTALRTPWPEPLAERDVAPRTRIELVSTRLDKPPSTPVDLRGLAARLGIGPRSAISKTASPPWIRAMAAVAGSDPARATFRASASPCEHRNGVTAETRTRIRWVKTSDADLCTTITRCGDRESNPALDAGNVACDQCTIAARWDRLESNQLRAALQTAALPIELLSRGTPSRNRTPNAKFWRLRCDHRPAYCSRGRSRTRSFCVNSATSVRRTSLE